MKRNPAAISRRIKGAGGSADRVEMLQSDYHVMLGAYHKVEVLRYMLDRDPLTLDDVRELIGKGEFATGELFKVMMQERTSRAELLEQMLADSAFGAVADKLREMASRERGE